MERRTFLGVIAGGLLAAPLAAEAQQANPYRIGVVFEGGPYYAVVDGLREGLHEFKLEEGTHFVFDIRDGHGDLAASEKAAQDLERKNINLIYVWHNGHRRGEAGDDPHSDRVLRWFRPRGLRCRGELREARRETHGRTLVG